MDNDKLDRIVLLLENINKDMTIQFEQVNNRLDTIEKHLEKHTGQLAAIAEAVNATNSNLTSKIDVVDKKVNINAVDILELRAAK